jgi:hypothetical protein
MRSWTSLTLPLAFLAFPVPALAAPADESPTYGPVLPAAAAAAQTAPDAADEASADGAAQAPAAAGGDAQDLAKQLSNPITSLISVPFQWNLDFGAGPDGDGVKSTLNIQPVVPLGITPKWNMIVRTILPVIYQDEVAPLGGDQFRARRRDPKLLLLAQGNRAERNRLGRGACLPLSERHRPVPRGRKMGRRANRRAAEADGE